MSPDQHRPDWLIWATRGRSWGFRFLLDGGLPDPLGALERAFAGVEDAPTAWSRDSGAVALRFPDPLGRRDAAGRLIPHEFVVFGDLVEGIDSVESGMARVWPVVVGAYARIWDAEGPPSQADLRFNPHGEPHPDAPRPSGSEPTR